MAVESFQTEFYKDYNEITQSLEEIESKIDSSAGENERKFQFGSEYEKISKRIETLQKYFTEHTSFLPTYEVRKAQEHLGKIDRLAQEKRDKIVPKKKFGFKSKQNLTSLESKIESEAVTAAATSKLKPTVDLDINVESTCCLRGLRDQTVVKLEEEINGKDVAIIDVKNTTICLQGSPSVLHIDSIDSCTILCGPVVGSTFINKCTNSKLVLACHQLRIHETNNTQFYIHVGSRAIIENTRDVAFAPFTWTFPRLDDHFSSSNLKPTGEYNYTAIDDFNWLNEGQKSPHWRFLEESEQLKWVTDDKGQIKTL